MKTLGSQLLSMPRDWTRSYPEVSHGEGVYLYDTEGNRYMDASGGSSVVNTLGHGVKEIAEAVAAQHAQVAHPPAHAFISRSVRELGERIASLAPGRMRGNCRTWFSSNGSDATEDAVRLARQHAVLTGQPSRHVVIGRWQAFHGNTIGTAGFSGHTFRRRMYQPMLQEGVHIPPAYCYRCYFEKTYPGCGLLCARALRTAIRQQGPENVLAFIAEPVVGASLAAVAAPPGYFQVIREICDEFGVILIADEVMTAWGRVGKWFGIEHWDVTPDIIATAKGLTAGYAPLAATIARNEIVEPLISQGHAFRAGHTYNANPVSAAASLAALDYLEANGLLARATEMGERFGEQLRERVLPLPIVGDVRGKGMMLGVELVADKANKEPFAPELAVSRRVEDAAFERGLIVYACTGCVEGAAGDMILMGPPLIIGREQVDECVAILAEAVEAVGKEM